jgi:hypothetical protein
MRHSLLAGAAQGRPSKLMDAPGGVNAFPRSATPAGSGAMGGDC